MKVSVVISICDNRYSLFERSLYSWEKQTLNKDDFELIIVDDSHRDDILHLCKKFNLNFQFIRIDNNRCDVPVTTFIPVLSNNVGFRQARGEVVVVTGPETLQMEKNLEIISGIEDNYVFGLVLMSNKNFVNTISNYWDKIKDYSFFDLLCIKGSYVDCLTKPPHPPAYWFLSAVKKKHVEAIGGVDEKFAQGLCGEDDDFANRMKMSGIKPIFNHSIVGIHQDHSNSDAKDEKHSIREEEDGKKLRQRNIQLVQENLNNKIIVANNSHRWGDEKVITMHETFRGAL